MVKVRIVEPGLVLRLALRLRLELRRGWGLAL